MAKSVFVTGAGRGIGRAIALKLAASGYEVFGCSRSKPELDETARLSGGKVKTTLVDVRDAKALTRWIETGLKAKDTTPWGLVTAAGIHGSISPFIEADFEDWKIAMEVNLYGTALACQVFARNLVAKKLPGRIVNLSGGGATQPMPNLSVYSASKAAVVRFSETLALELKDYGITVNSLAPGAVNTAITDSILAAGPAKAGQALYDKTMKQKQEGGQSADKAAALAEYLMSDKAAPVTARLISAIWDEWSTLDEQKLDGTDVYTLRRIVPADRPEVKLK